MLPNSFCCPTVSYASFGLKITFLNGILNIFHSYCIFSCDITLSSCIPILFYYLAAVFPTEHFCCPSFCKTLCHVCLNNGAIVYCSRYSGLCPPRPTACPLWFFLLLLLHLLDLSWSEDGGSRWSSTRSRRGTLGGHKGLTAGSQT